MQLEFEFTWFQFCDLVDNETGEIIGGASLECYHIDDNLYFEWVIADFEMSDFDFAPYTPYVAPRRCA